ncbi:uncharacterized protein LOC134338984 [Mobula hypostoma]|uniref:uncharacterized protein LOC134338984 n=1 Tax=Mobula hypostoma TaxID=723540 RepID=UPI002FC355F8
MVSNPVLCACLSTEEVRSREAAEEDRRSIGCCTAVKLGVTPGRGQGLVSVLHGSQGLFQDEEEERNTRRLQARGLWALREIRELTVGGGPAIGAQSPSECGSQENESSLQQAEDTAQGSDGMLAPETSSPQKEAPFLCLDLPTMLGSSSTRRDEEQPHIQSPRAALAREELLEPTTSSTSVAHLRKVTKTTGSHVTFAPGPPVTHGPPPEVERLPAPGFSCLRKVGASASQVSFRPSPSGLPHSSLHPPGPRLAFPRFTKPWGQSRGSSPGFLVRPCLAAGGDEDTGDDGFSDMVVGSLDDRFGGPLMHTLDGGSSDIMEDTQDGGSNDIMEDTQDGGSSDIMEDTQDGSSSDLMGDIEDGGSSVLLGDTEDDGCSDLMGDIEDGGSSVLLGETEDDGSGVLLADSQDGGSSDLLADCQDGGSSDLMGDTQDGDSHNFMGDTQDGGSSFFMEDTQDGGSSDLMEDTQDGSSSDIMGDTQGGGSSDLMGDTQDGSSSDLMGDTRGGGSSDFMGDTQDSYSVSCVRLADSQDGDSMAVNQDGEGSHLLANSQDNSSGTTLSSQEGESTDPLEDAQGGGLVLAESYRPAGPAELGRPPASPGHELPLAMEEPEAGPSQVMDPVAQPDMQDVYAELQQDMFYKAFLFHKFMKLGSPQHKPGHQQTKEHP